MSRLIALTRETLAAKIDELEYSPAGHIDARTVAGSALVAGWSDCTGSDLVKGRYRGVCVSFSDIILTHEGHNTDSYIPYTVTDFRGVFIIMSLPRSVSPGVSVLSKGLLGDPRLLKTPYPEFNRYYGVKTEGNDAEKQIITPEFASALVNRKKDGGSELKMAFSGSFAYIAAENKTNLFEDGNGSDEELGKRLARELEFVTEIMDALIDKTRLFAPVKY